MWITSSLSSVKKPTKVALGNFDGVHLGHQHVIEPVLSHTKGLPALGVDANICLQSAAASGYSNLPGIGAGECEGKMGLPYSRPWASVVTFFPHPKEFFSGQARSLLTPLEEKSQQLARLGVDQLVLLPFNQALAELDARQFVEDILIQGLQATHISIGSDFHFGRGRSGNAELLRKIAAAHGIPTAVVSLRHDDDGRISSSRIRQALLEGNIARANDLLGRSYTLMGTVVGGQRLGRTLGFPTANLRLPMDKFIPRCGVYGVQVCGVVSGQSLPGVMNIGYRPTVAGQSLSLEVHVLDWSGDLYGQSLTVSLESFVRPEQKFDSLEQLKQQILHDCEQVRQQQLTS